MTRLELKLRATTQFDQAPIVIEVLDADFATVWEGRAVVGKRVFTGVLQPGRYATRAYLPAGDILTQQVTIEPQSPNPFPVELRLPGETRKSVYRSAEDGESESIPPQPSASYDYTPITKGIDNAPATRLDQLAEKIWLRLWEQPSAAEAWRVVPWFGQRVRLHVNLIQYTFRPPYRGRYDAKYYLQVGGVPMRPRLFALPPDQAIVAFGAVQTNEKQETPLKITVSHVNQTVESLMGYMNSGAMDRATHIAQDLLRAKYVGPVAATIGAYYLLRTDLLSQHEGWAENLARDMTWLPDGAVIYAWYLLKQSSPDLTAVQKWLLQAVERGIPIYTEGLRLLYDALGMFAELETTVKDTRIDSALASVRPYAAVADWHAQTVSFPGSDPQTPTPGSLQNRSTAQSMRLNRMHAVSLAGDYLD